VRPPAAFGFRRTDEPDWEYSTDGGKTRVTLSQAWTIFGTKIQ